MPTNAELLSQIAKLQAEKAALITAAEAKGKARLSLKVSLKGAVSLYGVGRWPVTLYASQWGTVLAQAKAIEAFLVEHKAELATDEDKAAYKAAQAAAQAAVKPAV